MHLHLSLTQLYFVLFSTYSCPDASVLLSVLSAALGDEIMFNEFCVRLFAHVQLQLYLLPDYPLGSPVADQYAARLLADPATLAASTGGGAGGGMAGSMFASRLATLLAQKTTQQYHLNSPISTTTAAKSSPSSSSSSNSSFTFPPVRNASSSSLLKK
jgi:hypothetical protein